MEYKNVYEMFCATVAKNGEAPAYFERVNNAWSKITWQTMKEQVDNFGLSLLKHGLKPEDTVSILAGNDFVWPVADLGTIAAGGIGVGIYPSSSPDQCAYILNHSNCKFVVVDTLIQLEKIIKIKDKVPSLKVIISKVPHEQAVLWQDFLNCASQEDYNKYQEIAKNRSYEDTVVIVYTSGTTGHPKGACLSNRYIISSCVSLYKVTESFQDTPAYKKLAPETNLIGLSFLPFCHVAERIVGLYSRIYANATAYFVDNPAKLYEYMLEVNPHVFGGIPRFYEKIYAKIQNEIEQQKISKDDVAKAIEMSKQVIPYNQKKENLPDSLQKDWNWAEENVYSKIRSSFGSAIVQCSSGAAPIPKEIIEFFAYAANLNILEAYGLTEFVCCASNTPHKQKPNSVGQAMFGCEIRIAADGEILLKGPQMFSGYYKNEEATKEMINDEGWLCTGDIGKLDEDGFLYITGRKKEFIKTSTGKKIAPLYVENLCKRNHLISNVMVYGDNKKYLVALITLNEPELIAYAKVHKLKYEKYDEILRSAEIQKIIADVVLNVNEQVSSTEQIKKYHVLPQDFSIEENEITPTGKIKRKNVSEKYHDVIESMYTA